MFWIFVLVAISAAVEGVVVGILWKNIKKVPGLPFFSGIVAATP